MKEITEDKGRVRPVVEGDFQCDENGNSTRLYEVLSIVGLAKDDGTKLGYISKTNVPIGIPITNTEYWYPFQVIGVPKGDKGDKGDDGKSAYELYIEHGGTIVPEEAWIASLQGKDGKDAQPLLLRVSADGQSLEISDDGGQTWYLFQKNFNKLRVLGYVDNISKLPRIAEIGDIYGVLQEPVEPGEEATYLLYINTVKDWLKDYTITRVYDYDTELPSSAVDGTTVLVPVDYLTLDKQKIDGYKVYRFVVERNGWVLILDTAEIYASKDDIINRGDNKFALVQGEEPNTYDLYRRDVGWVYFGTNASITYVLVQDVEEGTETNILSGLSIKLRFAALAAALDEFKPEVIDSSEYIQVIKDSVGHVLFAFNKFTGKPYFPSNDTYHVITNDEWLAAWITTNNQILFGFRKDGTTYIGDSNLVKAVKEINEYISYFNLDDNPEFLSVNVDEKNKLINGVKINGNNYFETPIETPSTIIQTIDNPEFVKAFVDDTNKLVSYRTKDGIKVENIGFKTNKLILTPEGMTEFQEDLKAAGFRPGGGGDFSDVITNKGKNPVYIPIPNCASLNIISNVDLTTLSKADRGGTQKVNYDVKVEVEFFDGQGIYFRKWALIGAQGNSSMDFIKKNIALKIFDTENVENNKGKWGKGDTFGIKFGDWVMQKSFHLKAYYTDYLRGGAMVAYQLADQAYKTRGFYRDRPWKEALVDIEHIGYATPANLSKDGTKDVSLQIDNGARCMPDGFPVIVYQNGEFYGIFSWQIKKDIDNYHLDGKNKKHIHIDGDLYSFNLWGGTVNWNAFEIRCPEDLITMTGEDYDGDHPSELIDSTSAYYDSEDPQHVLSANVKQYIIDLSHRVGEINTLNNTDVEGAKALFDTCFDADNLIDYEVINMACGDTDGFGKNWQWITYDGVKWWCCQYDKDMAFGNHFTGMLTTLPRTGFIGNDVSTPMGLCIRYYQNAIKTRWNELVAANIFTADNIKTKVLNWVNRIGENNYKKEWSKWSQAPCNRASNIDFTNWMFTGNISTQENIPVGGVIWSDSDSYSVGNKVWFKSFDTVWYLEFEAVSINTNKPCIKAEYSMYPKTMGYRDSIWRFYKYIEQTLINQNDFISSLS